MSIDKKSCCSTQVRSGLLHVKAGMTVIVTDTEGAFRMADVIWVDGGARNPKVPTLFQVAGRYSINWINADLVTHIVPRVKPGRRHGRRRGLWLWAWLKTCLALSNFFDQACVSPMDNRALFSNTAKSKTSKKKPVQASAYHAEKEQLAVALINHEKLQEAEAIYKELISLGTSNHSVYGNLATLCGMQGRFDECIKYLHKVLDLKPNFPEALHNLGTAPRKKVSSKPQLMHTQKR